MFQYRTILWWKIRPVHTQKRCKQQNIPNLLWPNLPHSPLGTLHLVAPVDFYAGGSSMYFTPTDIEVFYETTS